MSSGGCGPRRAVRRPLSRRGRRDARPDVGRRSCPAISPRYSDSRTSKMPTSLEQPGQTRNRAKPSLRSQHKHSITFHASCAGLSPPDRRMWKAWPCCRGGVRCFVTRLRRKAAVRAHSLTRRLTWSSHAVQLNRQVLLCATLLYYLAFDPPAVYTARHHTFRPQPSWRLALAPPRAQHATPAIPAPYRPPRARPH